MSDKRKAFEEYDFTTDPRWSQYRDNLTFPPNSNEYSLLAKYKQKFYKRYVDPNFELFDSTETKTNTNNNNNTNTNNTSTSQQSTNTNRNASSPSSSSRIPTQPAPLGSYVFSIQLLWLVANILVVIHTVIYIFGNYDAYGRLFLFAGITYILSLYKNYGRPRFNQEYLAQIMLDDNFQYLMFCLFFFGKMLTLAIIPIVTCSFFHVCNYFKQLLQTRVPSIYQRYGYIFDSILTRQVAALNSNANCELFIAVFLFVDIFLSGFLNGILMFIVYMNFLNLRYLRSPYTRSKMDTIGYTLDMYANHPACPGIIRTLYLKIRQTLSSYFRPRAA